MPAARWPTVEELRPHLNPIVDELGHMPTGPELKARGQQDLLGAISRFGGTRHDATALGYPSTNRHPSEWRSVADLRPELDPIVAELGHMPMTQELRARGKQSLIGPITKFGGFQAVAQQLD